MSSRKSCLWNDDPKTGVTTMQATKTDELEKKLTVEQSLQIRKEAGLRIDPETAEVMCTYAYTGDPYGVYNLAEEHRQVGKVYFSRSPGSDIWVLIGDLPPEV